MTPTRPDHPDEGATGDPAEYWYINALLQAPGSPIDGWALAGVFLRVRSQFDEGKVLLIPPGPGADSVDLGTGPMPPGSLLATAGGLDLRIAENTLRGAHPNWTLHLEGHANGHRYVADLDYAARAGLDEVTSVEGGLRHQACYRTSATGTITIDERAWDVRGVGFYEHVHGSFGWQDDEPERLPVAGWSWYTTPGEHDGDVALSLWTYFTADRRVPPHTALTIDGRTFHHLDTGRQETLQTRDIDGMSYPHRLRVTDRGPDGAIDLTITRRDVDARSITEPGQPSRTFFLSGYADFDGHVEINGRRHRVPSRGFGSAFERSTDPHRNQRKGTESP